MGRSIASSAWVRRLRAAIIVGRRGDDPEGIHQVRVACRRLSAWLDLGGRRIGRDDLKWLRDAAGPIRDLDVLLMHDDVPLAMNRWLRSQWRKERPALLEALDAPRALGTVHLFENMGPLKTDDVPKGMARLLDKAERAIDAVDEQSPDPAQLHLVRRRLRPIRYALEWLKRDASPIVAAQDALGALSDDVLLHRMTVAWGKDPARAKALAAQLALLARAAVPTLPAIRATLKELR
jgi:CHAD domain-containing protein